MASDSRAKVLVFAETKKKCDELTRTMRKNGYPAMCIHGDKKQEERDWVLGEFRSGRTQILVATDVAARGLGNLKTISPSSRTYFPLRFAYVISTRRSVTGNLAQFISVIKSMK